MFENVASQWRSASTGGRMFAHPMITVKVKIKDGGNKSIRLGIAPHEFSQSRYCTNLRKRV